MAENHDNFFEKIKKAGNKVNKYSREKENARKTTPLAVMMIHDALPFLTIVAFLTLGIVGGWWHPAWLVFFIIPIYYMTENAIVHKSAEMAPVVPIVIAVYLCIGCVKGAWHPYWAILVAIPLYYMIIAAIKGANWSKIFDIAVPLVSVGIYLAFGFSLNAWHPAWLVFFLVPLYFILKNTVSRYKSIREEDDYEIK